MIWDIQTFWEGPLLVSRNIGKMVNQKRQKLETILQKLSEEKFWERQETKQNQAQPSKEMLEPTVPEKIAMSEMVPKTEED